MLSSFHEPSSVRILPIFLFYLPCCRRMAAMSLGSASRSSVPGGARLTPHWGPGAGPLLVPLSAPSHSPCRLGRRWISESARRRDLLGGGTGATAAVVQVADRGSRGVHVPTAAARDGAYAPAAAVVQPPSDSSVMRTRCRAAARGRGQEREDRGSKFGRDGRIRPQNY